MVKGIRRIVADKDIGRLDFLSFTSFAFFAGRREKSELFAWLDKHDFARDDDAAHSSVF